MESPPKIGAIGTYIPARRVSNREKLADFGVNEAMLQTKLGILSRAVKEKDETASDLCIRAFEDLAAQVNIERSDIELCCVVTQNPDHNIPHMAAIVHERLGLSKRCMTFDISQGCAGYVHGIALVTSMMERFGLSRGLLFTSDPYSNIVDPDDKDTALIFGDAATASYITRSGGGYALVDANFGTLPGSSECLISSNTWKPSEDEPPCPALKMDGTAVLFHAVHEVPGSIRALLDKQKVAVADIDTFLLHQASKRVVDLIKADLKLSSEKVPFEVADYGNTISSSIPLMLKRQLNEKKPQRIVMSGFGVGFTWGSCLVELRE